jgi:cytochrome c-type biogenesis protein CcmH/NrfG
MSAAARRQNRNDSENGGTHPPQAVMLAKDASANLAIPEALDEARVECERLRLLLESKDTQEAARLALRHCLRGLGARTRWRRPAGGRLS